MSTILLWLKIIRVQTLPASVCPVVAGLLASGINRPSVAAVTVFCALALQIFSNLVNDYYDFKRGTDVKGRAGFSRALTTGEVNENQIRRACITVLAAAVVSGAYLVYAGGWPILLIGLTAILFAWLYTATDHSLSYLGIADIFVFLYYGVLSSVGTGWLQGATLLHTSFWSGGVCGLISMCVLMTNNLRDMEGDALAGKRTFPVRFGKKAGECAYLAAVLLTPLFAYKAYGLSLPLIIVLPGLFLYFRLLRCEGKMYNGNLMLAGLMNVLYICLVLTSQV